MRVYMCVSVYVRLCVCVCVWGGGGVLVDEWGVVTSRLSNASFK